MQCIGFWTVLWYALHLWGNSVHKSLLNFENLDSGIFWAPVGQKYPYRISLCLQTFNAMYTFEASKARPKDVLFRCMILTNC